MYAPLGYLSHLLFFNSNTNMCSSEILENIHKVSPLVKASWPVYLSHLILDINCAAQDTRRKTSECPEYVYDQSLNVGSI